MDYIITDFYDVVFYGLENENRVNYLLQIIEQKDGVSCGVYGKHLVFTEDEFFRKCRKIIQEYKRNIELQHASDLLEAKMIHHQLRLTYELPYYDKEGKEMIREYLEEMKDKVSKLEERGWQTNGWCSRLYHLWQDNLEDEWKSRLNYVESPSNLSNLWREDKTKNLTGEKRIFYTQILELEKAIDEVERTVMDKPTSSSSEVQSENLTTEKAINQDESSTQDKQITFTDLLHHDNKDTLLEKLHELIDGKKAKSVALTIHALNNLSFLTYESKKELYDTMYNEFEITFTDSGFNQFLNPNHKSILETDIERIKTILSAIK